MNGALHAEALVMLEEIIWDLSQQLLPPAQRQIRGVTFGGRVAVPAHWLATRLGQTLPYPEDQGDIVIAVPSLQVLSETVIRLPEQQTTGRSPLDRFGRSVGMTDEQIERCDWSEGAHMWRILEGPERQQSLAHVLRAAGMAMLHDWLINYHQIVRGNPRFLEAERNKARLQAKMAIDLARDLTGFDATAAEAATGLADLAEFLPPGSGQERGGAGAGAGEEPALGEEEEPGEGDAIEILGEEAQAPAEGAQSERDRFYMEELGCVRRVEARYLGRRRRYTAYIFCTTQNQEVAILDTDVRGNAAYLFLVGPVRVQGQAAPPAAQPPEQSAWVQDAGRTKGELTGAQPGQQGTFLRRFIHNVGWQDRLRAYLAGPLGPA
jgi:hypothetical protein